MKRLNSILLIVLLLMILPFALAGQSRIDKLFQTEDYPLVINEVGSKSDDEAPDFVELFNRSDESFQIDRGRWFVGNMLEETNKYYAVPPRVVPAGGFLVLKCDGTGIGLHTSFKLGKKDAVGLFRYDGEEYRLVEKRSWSAHEPERSKGRLPDGSETWVNDDTLQRTPGESNEAIPEQPGLFDFEGLLKIPRDINKMLFTALLVTVLAFILILVYRATYLGKEFNTTFVQAIFLITVLLSFIMQIIGNSLARAFGMMGAVSIARFRTKVEDAKDTSFVLFAIGVGMACGLGHYALAIFMTLFTSLIAVVFYTLRHHLSPPKTDVLQSLIIELSDYGESKEILENKLRDMNVSFQMITLEEREQAILLTYNIRFKSKLNADHLASEIKATLGDRIIGFRWGSPMKAGGSLF